MVLFYVLARISHDSHAKRNFPKTHPELEIVISFSSAVYIPFW